MFWEIYVDLCKEHNASPNAVAKELGFSTGTCTWWKKGRMPQMSALSRIADYFGVTVEYLLGKETEKPQKEKTPTEEALKVALFGGADVPDELWDKVTEYAKFLVEQDKRNRK